jgi:hypothetical protein
MDQIFHNDRKRTITEIDKNCFVIEGKSQYLKWSLSEPPKSVEFDSGPRLLLGNNFYNKGKIVKLEKAETEESSNKAVRVIVEN